MRSTKFEMKILHHIISKLKEHSLYPVLLCYFLLFFSCQDNGLVNEAGGEDIPEGMAQIKLLIPDYDSGAAQFGTRALNVSEEGYMSNLYVVAIKYADFKDNGEVVTYDNPKETAPVYIYSLNSVGMKFEVGNNNYHAFNMLLYPGKYRIGVIANVDLYLSERAKKVSEFTKETDLESIILNFSEDTPLVPRHLPMVCLPWNIKYSTDNGVTEIPVKDDYLIDIKRNETPLILAHMDFLCSKVRYTILFDKTPGGISEAFGSSWIRFNVDDQLKPWATNIRKQTKLVETYKGEEIYTPEDQIITHLDASNNLQPASWPISIDRYYYDLEAEFTEEQRALISEHKFEGANYPKSYKSELIPWDGTTDQWIPRERKIWQGVVYLPENPGEDGIDKTILKFPYHTRINSQDDTPEVEATNPKEIELFADSHDKYGSTDKDDNYIKGSSSDSFSGLDRDYMYDVVAKVVSPNDLTPLTVQVFVSIIPWHETDQNISESLPGSRPSSSEVDDIINPWESEEYDNPW